MLRSLKISGFKKFRGKTIELKELKRINVLVGVNGSGKSTILELLAISSRFDTINPGIIPIGGSNFIELDSLFGRQTEVSMGFDNANLAFTIKEGRRNIGWTFEKEGSPEGSMEVVAVWKSNAFSPDGEPSANNPFGSIRVIGIENIEPTYLESAQEFQKTIHEEQQLFTTGYSRGEDFYKEGTEEIWPQRLAGGTQYLGMLLKAIGSMTASGRPAATLLIDDLGDSIFPALRKAIIPRLNEELEKHQENQRAQMFATTHNIEIVKSALEHPDYCSVYMFDYDGSLIEFDGLDIKKVDSSSGLKSMQEIPIIAKMLGLTDLDLGFPEIVILAEEETKRTFLNAIQKNPQFEGSLKKYEVQIPYQQGDGNISKAINSLLDLSKYFSFSEIWSDRYVIFTDYNSQFYDESGNVKVDDSQHMKALKKAQEKLTMGKNFLLTKKGNQFVLSIEDTYPDNLWEDFKTQKSISQNLIQDWIKSKNKNEKGAAKNELAEFVGMNITPEIFKSSYSELASAITK